MKVIIFEVRFIELLRVAVGRSWWSKLIDPKIERVETQNMKNNTKKKKSPFFTFSFVVFFLNGGFYLFHSLAPNFVTTVVNS